MLTTQLHAQIGMLAAGLMAAPPAATVPRVQPGPLGTLIVHDAAVVHVWSDPDHPVLLISPQGADVHEPLVLNVGGKWGMLAADYAADPDRVRRWRAEYGDAWPGRRRDTLARWPPGEIVLRPLRYPVEVRVLSVGGVTATTWPQGTDVDGDGHAGGMRDLLQVLQWREDGLMQHGDFLAYLAAWYAAGGGT